VWAVVGVPILGGLAVAVVGGPAHWPQNAPYLAVVAIASILLFYRFWRMGVRFDDHGVRLRGFLRTDRFGWPEVSHFADGHATVSGGESSAVVWALAVVLHDGRVITVSATAGATHPQNCGGHRPGRRALSDPRGADRRDANRA
jgi:hypothetical protein